MPRQLFTAADVRRVAREQKSVVLVLGPADLITPEAVDVARELGLQLVREQASSPPSVSPPGIGARAGPLPPLKLARGAGLALDAFGAGLTTPGMRVALKDVVAAADGSPMAAGFMTLEAPVPRGAPAGGASGQLAEFKWTLTYDEVDIVLAGELVITRGVEQVRGGPGDVIFIPKGSSITFGTPSRADFVYVAFPANWNELG
jgi:ethanolamine utilization protein EutQ